MVCLKNLSWSTIAKYAKNANIKAENSFLVLMMSSAIGTSPIIDKFSTWLLAGCGATAALMITNMNAIIPLIGNLEFKLSIYLLIALALAGLLQKYKSIALQIFHGITERLNQEASVIETEQQKTFKELQMTGKEHGVDLGISLSVDIQRIKKEFSEAAPFFLRNKAIKNFEKGSKDILHGWRKMLKVLKWQYYYLVLQIIFFIVFIFIPVISL